MDIAIIDADLIRRKNHRFPNLASMKLSSYYKNAGNNVVLETNYNNLHSYDKILILLFTVPSVFIFKCSCRKFFLQFF